MPDLVTGAAGFIGRRLCARLLGTGRAVRGLALPGEDVSGLDPAVEVVRGDITDRDSMLSATRGAQRVYHLAAVVGDWGPDELFERVNVGGTRNVLDAAVTAGADRVVLASSIVVYGSGLRGAVCDEQETPRERGVGPYSRTKRAQEEIALDYHQFGRVEVSIVRPGNVYGPESGLWVHELVRQLRAGMVPLIDDGNGNACMAYVDNVVEVLALAGEVPGAAGNIYNANDGSGVSWRRYLSDLAAAAGAAPPRVHLPGPLAAATGLAMETVWRAIGASQRPLMTAEAAMLLRSRADVSIERARRDLGFEPPVPYDEAMRRVAARLSEAPAHSTGGPS